MEDDPEIWGWTGVFFKASNALKREGIVMQFFKKSLEQCTVDPWTVRDRGIRNVDHPHGWKFTYNFYDQFSSVAQSCPNSL